MAATKDILAGRSLVETYRQQHHDMYQKESVDIPAEHEIILSELIKGLSALGFRSLQEFFDTSDLVG